MPQRWFIIVGLSSIASSPLRPFGGASSSQAPSGKDVSSPRLELRPLSSRRAPVSRVWGRARRRRPRPLPAPPAHPAQPGPLLLRAVPRPRESWQRPLWPGLGEPRLPNPRMPALFLFSRPSPRAPLSDWLAESGQFFPGRRAAQPPVLLLAPPPEPVDWTAQAGVTRLRGAQKSQSGAWRILQTGEVAAAEASQERANEIGVSRGGSEEGAAWRS